MAQTRSTHDTDIKDRKKQNPSPETSDHTCYAQNVAFASKAPTILEPQFPLDDIQTFVKQCKCEIYIQSVWSAEYPPSFLQLRESEREV